MKRGADSTDSRGEGYDRAMEMTLTEKVKSVSMFNCKYIKHLW